MKKKTIVLFIISILMVLTTTDNSFAGSKNFLKQLIKVYQDYEEINMMLWLTGDVKAEKRLGKELATWQKLTSKQEGDKAKVDRVMRIFNKLAPQYNTHGMGLRCTVLHDKTVNAFAIPGGNVYVYSGIVDFLQSDDELAAVIAHELAHVEKRHSLKNYRASAALTALLQKAVKNQKNKDLWCAVLSSLTLMQFSQKQEDEADDVGQYRLVAAGFNPYGQVNVWERFLKKYGDSSGIQKFLSSHPSHKARIENAKRNIAKMNYQLPTTEDSQNPPAEVPFENETTNSTNNTNAINDPNPAPRANFIAPETSDVISETNEPPQPDYQGNPTNLILDGGFENGYNSENRLENWEVSEGLFKLSDKVRLSGNLSLECSASGSFNKGRIYSNYIAVNNDSDLNIEVCVKSENGKQIGAVGVELYDKNKRLRNRVWVKEMMAFPAEWNKIEANLVNSDELKIFNKNTVYMRVLLQVGPSSNGTLWFDDISVTQN